MIFPEFSSPDPDIFLRYRAGRGAWFGFPLLLFGTLNCFARHCQIYRHPDGARITCPHALLHHGQQPANRAELLACHHLCRLSSTSCACSSGSACMRGQHGNIFCRNKFMQTVGKHRFTRYVRIFIHTVCDTTYVMVRFPNAITACFYWQYGFRTQ